VDRSVTIRLELKVSDHVVCAWRTAFEALVAHAPVITNRGGADEDLVGLVRRYGRVGEQLAERFVLRGINVPRIAKDETFDGHPVGWVHSTPQIDIELDIAAGLRLSSGARAASIIEMGYGFRGRAGAGLPHVAAGKVR
jgi:hypothetical protein